ncbi:MAG: outer membrane lipoprotein carrier protein LolA [Nitrospirota bacterium]
MKNRKTLFVSVFILLSVFISQSSYVSGEGPMKGAALSAEEKQDAGVRDLLLKLQNEVSDFDSLKTDFRQEKNLAVFSNKIVIKGRIYLRKPGTVAWHVDEPLKYSVLITDKLIRQWDEDTDRVQEIPLSTNPMFRVVIDQLTAWFSGQYVQLLDEYSVSVRSEHPLQLEFRPRESGNIKKIIKTITVTFREDRKYLQRVQFDEISGDSTIIIFSNTEFNAPMKSSDFEVKRRV